MLADVVSDFLAAASHEGGEGAPSSHNARGLEIGAGAGLPALGLSLCLCLSLSLSVSLSL